MTGPALKTFFYIIECWQIPDEDARELLGGVSNGRYYQMKKEQERRILSADEAIQDLLLDRHLQGPEHPAWAISC